jgi:hypothetical protein
VQDVWLRAAAVGGEKLVRKKYSKYPYRKLVQSFTLQTDISSS